MKRDREGGRWSDAAHAVRRLALDISPLRESRDFRLLWLGQMVSLVGRQLTVVAIPYQVYLITHSSIAVGAIGVAQVVPYVALSLLGGPLVDRVDRRKLLLVTQSLLAAASALLVAGAIAGFASLPFLYGLAAVISGLSAMDLPAESAITPNLVRAQHLAAAVSLNFGQFQASLVLGPAIGGLVLAHLGLPTAYAIDMLSFAASIAALVAIAPQPPRGAIRENALVALGQGLKFVTRQGEVMGGFAVDLNAMIFGMPRALFPALAVGTYHAGPAGLGLLYAAPGTGAVLGTLLSGFVGRIRYQGRAVVVSAMIWGVAIGAFALATSSLWLGLLLLAIAGGADIISAISRNTVLQTVSPDHLRGRASAANSMVVVGGPMLGDLRAGTLGGLVSPQFSLLSGSVLCVAGCAVVAWLFPALRQYHAPSVVAPLEREQLEREPV